MSSFIETSACAGRRPRQLASLRCFPRSDLIARLLRDRQVARFVVAPDGFGKSSLAFGYADTVFSFQHVMWINGKSPCFLRDLDKGIIASGIKQVDSDAALVVMDDLPQLAPDRANALSAEIDALLAQECEVLVCCAPSCDAFGSLQRDRLKLSPSDLLLVDDGASMGEEDARLGSASRVAGLRQDSGLTSRSFLAGIAQEELPADLVLAMVVLLVLQRGSLGELQAFGTCGASELGILAEEYPFLGIDCDSDAFFAPWFEPGDIVAAFSKRLDAAAAWSHFGSRSALARSLADALLARREAKRACAIVSELCVQAEKVQWLEQRRFELAKQACALSAYDLSLAAGKSKASLRMRLDADDAWRAAVLGDTDQACRHARRACSQTSEMAQVMGLLVLLRLGNGDDRRRAAEQLAGWAAAPLPGADGEGASVAAWTRPLAAMGSLATQSRTRAREQWQRWRAIEGSADALTVVALWLFEDARTLRLPIEEREGDAALSDEDASFLRALQDDGFLSDCARHVAQRLARLPEGDMDAFAALASSAWEELRRERPQLSLDDPLDTVAAARAAREVQETMFAQRKELADRRRIRARKQQEYALTHPDSYLDGRYLTGPASVSATEPLLTVKLFGGVEAWIGDKQVDPVKLRRQKVKTLLALLVLHRGRELSRDRLLAVMWPEGERESARKNFYTIWSLLRSALLLPNGTCPYLIRQQNVCAVKGSLLRSDVADLDEVCRTLMFGDLDSDGWAALSADVDRRFSDDLMPGERVTEAIDRMRRECRVRLVDALVAASRRLGRAGNVQESLWFARAALMRDRSREDVYTALMRAQVDAGQRSAALDTYFACRRFLAEELGIDPSPETMAVYRSIIETEEGLL